MKKIYLQRLGLAIFLLPAIFSSLMAKNLNKNKFDIFHSSVYLYSDEEYIDIGYASAWMAYPLISRSRLPTKEDIFVYIECNGKCGSLSGHLKLNCSTKKNNMFMWLVMGDSFYEKKSIEKSVPKEIIPEAIKRFCK